MILVSTGCAVKIPIKHSRDMNYAHYFLRHITHCFTHVFINTENDIFTTKLFHATHYDDEDKILVVARKRVAREHLRVYIGFPSVHLLIILLRSRIIQALKTLPGILV